LLNKKQPKVIFCPKKLEEDKAMIQQDDQQDDNCGICMESMKSVKRGKLNCCDHMFCEECITKQFQYNSRCPMCRREFVHVNGILQIKTQMPQRNDFPLTELSIEESEERERAAYQNSSARPKRAIQMTEAMSLHLARIEFQRNTEQQMQQHSFIFQTTSYPFPAPFNHCALSVQLRC
jgi:hypothetical protein